MASYINVTAVGNLGKDPKVADDGKWTHCSLATSVSWKDKGTDEWKEKTSWHSIMAYGYAAEKLAKCGKGDQILVNGSLDYFPAKVEGENPSAYINANKIVSLTKREAQPTDEIPFE
mgnify:FL=1